MSERDREPTDMSSDAIDRRLRKLSELLELCRRLAREASPGLATPAGTPPAEPEK